MRGPCINCQHVLIPVEGSKIGICRRYPPTPLVTIVPNKEGMVVPQIIMCHREVPMDYECGEFSEDIGKMMMKINQNRNR